MGGRMLIKQHENLLICLWVKHGAFLLSTYNYSSLHQNGASPPNWIKWLIVNALRFGGTIKPDNAIMVLSSKTLQKIT